VDWKNLYTRPATVKEQLRGEEPLTQFGRMCAKLGIAIIAASSPQAKGRVERSHGTHQDVCLEREYLPEHNQRFARAAARAENYQARGAHHWLGPVLRPKRSDRGSKGAIPHVLRTRSGNGLTAR
jgi:hypothetical protein